ncbi:MAG: hypothetical protein ACLFR1_09830, partial [Spirochaetia bacterium]
AESAASSEKRFGEIVTGIEKLSDALQANSSSLDELSSGNGEIREALTELVEASHDVRNVAQTLSEKMREVDNDMNTISQGSGETQEAIDNMLSALNTLQQAASDISGQGKENAEVIHSLQDILDRLGGKQEEE